MSDPIERQDVLNLLDSVYQYMGNWLVQYIEEGILSIPSVQPEIIHCKDCKYAHITYSGEVKYCDIWFPDESHYMDTDNFCSFAERREDEQ